MRNDVPTQSGRRYAAAYEAHYGRKALQEALRLYRELVAAHPTSREAGYSRAQIRNIVHEVVPERELLEAQVGCALAHFENSDPGQASRYPITPTRLGLLD
jgi:hypothetical protein